MNKVFDLIAVGADDTFELIPEGLGINQSGYPGAFTSPVERLVESALAEMTASKVLHLFSGISSIGDVRVDIHCKKATHIMDVGQFVSEHNEDYDCAILDPPYSISSVDKLAAYGKTSSVAANVPLRRALATFFYKHCENILWLDMCAPLPRGFKRHKVWLLFAGGYHTPRIFSWLKRDNSHDHKN